MLAATKELKPGRIKDSSDQLSVIRDVQDAVRFFESPRFAWWCDQVHPMTIDPVAALEAMKPKLKAARAWLVKERRKVRIQNRRKGRAAWT